MPTAKTVLPPIVKDAGLQNLKGLEGDTAVSSVIPTDFGSSALLELPIAAIQPAVDTATIPEEIAPLISTETPSLDWGVFLALAWMIGFAVLVARLFIAAWLLRRSACRCVEVHTGDRLHAALVRAMALIGVTRPVRLLVDRQRSIPIVWGLMKTRLQLPAESRNWTDEQLRSVLHHELAHVRRRDLFVLAITQIACAMHWFNPLVWFAAWRLHIERERACDDLVLASGIQASAYAQHLLNVATQSTSAPWTQSCGLAMARSSSIHSRLTAVLSKHQNRRSVTTTLLVLSLVAGSAVAIPLAMLRAADETSQNEPPADETTKRRVAKERLKPWTYRGMNTSLLRRWQQLEGPRKQIPETRVATLRSAISRFVEGIDQSQYSLTGEQITQMQALRTRGADRTLHTKLEAQKLINAVFEIHGEPIQMAFNEAPGPGTPGDASVLKRLPFGPAAPSGLRVALTCDREDFIFGDSARLDIRLWNSGSETLVVGIGRNSPGLYPKLELKAIGRNGRRIAAKVGAESRMLADTKFTKTWQLRPGETAEVYGYRIRVGTGTPRENESWPQWYTMIEFPDVLNGEEIQLTGSLPALDSPATNSSTEGMQTGIATIHATAPEDVQVWTASRAGTWSMPDGVTLQLKQESFHAADIATSVVLTWPTDETGTTYAFTTGVAFDAFANREPWHVVWEKDSTAFWAMTGPLGQRGTGLAIPARVRRIDFSDKSNIVTTTWYHRPETMSERIRLAFETRFKPLPSEPRRPKEADGFSVIGQAHDVRPINQLLNGVWKNRNGPVDIQLTFPQQATDGIRWTIDYGQREGDAVVDATVERINSPSDNSIRLWMRPDPLGTVNNEDVLGSLRRGSDSTLLLDIRKSPKFPDYKAATGVVLIRASASQPGNSDDENTDDVAADSSAARKLAPGLEQHLDWSEAVNGLRGAVMIRTVESQGGSDTERKIFLVLQNVSDKPIRFCDTDIHETNEVAADVEGRILSLSRNGTTLMGMQRAVSTQTDIILEARDVCLMDMLDSEQLEEQHPNPGELLADGVVKIPTRSLYAVLKIVHAPNGAWTGKLRTPTSRGAFAAVGPKPKDAQAQSLFRYCVDHARLSGEISGGLISRLHEMVQEFIRLNSGDTYGDPYAKKMQPLLARFEHQGDWKQADVAALFDEIAAVTAIPLDRTMMWIREHTLQRGGPLASSLKNANWGEPLPSGLRMAWILEPQADKYHLGSSLKSRVVLHNSGKKPVAFVTRSFHQPGHTAHLPDGSTVAIESTFWTTLGRPEPYRLHPGESCEVYAPGIGIGIGIGQRAESSDDWANVRPGSWIAAIRGQEIVFQPGEVLLTGDHNQKVDSDWWLKFIKERLDREAPLPADQKEREVILFRVVSDLFGNSPSPDEADAFYPDMSAEALNHLALVLSKRSWIKSAGGPIQSGETKFRVLAEDPDAATRVRVATNPGRYNLGELVRFVASRRSSGERIMNEANLVWYPPGKDSIALNIPVPDGYNTWAAAWLPGSTALWVQQEGLLRKYDFGNPANISEARFASNEAAGEPSEVRGAIQKALAVPDAPVRQRQPPASIK